MSVTASTRRAALGAILAAPLASGPVLAASASSSLTNLVARYERFDALLQAETEKLDKARWQFRNDYHDRLIGICGALRSRICLHPVATMADIMLKVRAYGLSQPYDDGREELTANLKDRDGHAYLDDVALAIVVDLIGLRDGRQCA